MAGRASRRAQRGRQLRGGRGELRARGRYLFGGAQQRRVGRDGARRAPQPGGGVALRIRQPGRPLAHPRPARRVSGTSHLLRGVGRAREASRGRAIDRRGRARGGLARRAMDRLRRGARGDRARAHGPFARRARTPVRRTPGRLVHRPRQPAHAHAGRRAGTAVRLGRLQRRPAVLDAGRRQAASGSALQLRLQRHALRLGAGFRHARRLHRPPAAHARLPAARRPPAGVDDVDRPALAPSEFPDVWFCRRRDIAQFWRHRFPATP
jgi:hypothetical protein